MTTPTNHPPASRRRCNTCGLTVGPRASTCPACGGEIRVTITEPGHGTIEYVLRKTPRTTIAEPAPTIPTTTVPDTRNNQPELLN
jgi:hypothetical protein